MAEDYTANDLERQILDPLFYYYEKAVRAQARLERQVAELKARPSLIQTVTDQASVILKLEATVARLYKERQAAEPKLKALYDAAQALVIEVAGHPHKSPTQRKRGIAAATTVLRKALAEAFEHCAEVPF